MQLQLSSSYLQIPSHLYLQHISFSDELQLDPQFIQLYKNPNTLMQWSDHEKETFYPCKKVITEKLGFMTSKPLCSVIVLYVGKGFIDRPILLYTYIYIKIII
jgi:hypothetical protein